MERTLRRVHRLTACVVVLACASVFVVERARAAIAPTAKPRPSGSITVSAAASLQDAFTQIKERFEKRYTRATVTFNFASSATLVTQIQGGAPADVFASADRTNMDKLVAAGHVTSSPTTFARNQMEIAVKPGNPKRVRSVADLRDVGTIALCGSSVPCGVYAARVLKKADVRIPESSITRGVDAKATLAAVAQGDANAAIVYVTDVRSAGTAVTGVAISDAHNAAAAYAIAPLASTSNPKLARAFASYVTSPRGQEVLAEHGFRAP